MIIPVKCYTCGKVLGNKYRFYEQELRRLKNATDDINSVTYLTNDNADKTVAGEILDKLKLNKICCRRHMLTHVEIE